ncbi:MAG: iron-containing redox enzyme family protein [Nitrospirae bacterium]|nr:iron-containing redox enzyme family protein [Nitrospirota bacterium]MDE3039578.1 iron-containing redox enzyme family protein [Nitrospirota bacterium]
MSFYQEMRQYVLRHGAINNLYLDRFQRGDLTDEEIRQFAVEFYNFARFFPKILVAQLVNTEDETVANELTKVLYSELGDGHSRKRHELLYRDFLRSIGKDVHEAMTQQMLPSTKSYIEGMEQLYSSGNHATALGASFGLENMAITMWDHLIPGLTRLRATRYPAMDMTYFTFHRELESGHEEAMEKAVAAIDGGIDAGAGGLSVQEREDFHRGVKAVLDYLEGFWTGLEKAGFQRRQDLEGAAVAPGRLHEGATQLTG